jgi:hypothetical protein
MSDAAATLTLEVGVHLPDRGVRQKQLTPITHRPSEVSRTGTTEPGKEAERTAFRRWFVDRVALYGTAEIAGSVTAAIGIGLTGLLYPNSVAVGIIGTVTENIGLYSALLYGAMRRAGRLLEAQDKSHTWQTRAEVVGTLVFQFGIAEICDSLLIRPALMGCGAAVGYYLGEHLLGQGSFAMVTGAVMCKFVADVIYWSIVEATSTVFRGNVGEVADRGERSPSTGETRRRSLKNRKRILDSTELAEV